MDVIINKPSPRGRWIKILAITAILAAVAVSALALPRVASRRASIDGDLAWIGNVHVAPLSITVQASGQLVPEAERWMTAPFDGTIESIRARAGDAVQSGDALVQLRNDDLQRLYRQMELEARSEHVQQTTLENRLRNEILDLQASIASLEAQLGQARLKLEADERLQREGLVAEIETESERFVVEGLSERLQIEHQRLERRRSSMKTELEAQRLRAERAQLAAQDARRDVDQLQMSAEIGGLVGEIVTTEGSSVRRGDRIARLIDPSRLRAVLDVPQVRARLIAVGQSVAIDTRNTVVRGEVSRIEPAVQDGTVRVDVTLLDPLPDDARAELRVDGTIEIEALGQALQIQRPQRARENADIDLFRLRAGESTAERVRVRLGRLSTKSAQIVSGLVEGDRVILSDTSGFEGIDLIRID